MLGWRGRIAGELHRRLYILRPRRTLIRLACLVAMVLGQGRGWRPKGLRPSTHPTRSRIDVRTVRSAVAASATLSNPQTEAVGDLRVIDHDVTLVGIDRVAWNERFIGLHVLGRRPELLDFEDVLVVPEHRALYDASGHLIAASVRRVQDRPQMPTFDAPPRIDVPLSAMSHPGHLLYAGTLWQHFGHFLVEGVARLWPLLTQDFDGVLCDRENPLVAATFREPVLQRLFPSVSGPRYACRAVRIRRVSVPEPTWVYWGDALASHTEVLHQTVSEHLVVPDRLSDQPVYFTRQYLPGFRRMASQEATLTDELARRGVLVVAPERLPIVEQLELVLAHGVIIGLTGSALHAGLFAAGTDRLTVHLTDSVNLVQPNFPVQDAVTRIPAAYIGCYREDPESPKGGADRDVLLEPAAAIAGLETLGILGC